MGLCVGGGGGEEGDEGVEGPGVGLGCALHIVGGQVAAGAGQPGRPHHPPVDADILSESCGYLDPGGICRTRHRIYVCRSGSETGLYLFNKEIGAPV